METKNIIIDRKKLEFLNNENEYITIDNENGSNLYHCHDENGNEYSYTRNEIKKYTDISSVDETLKNIKHKNFDEIYSDDMLNFIDENTLKQLQDTSEFFKVCFLEV